MTHLSALAVLKSLEMLEQVLLDIIERDEGVRAGSKSVWLGVESLYSMDGDLAPLRDMVDVIDRLLPRGNVHMVVDEVRSLSSSLLLLARSSGPR